MGCRTILDTLKKKKNSLLLVPGIETMYFSPYGRHPVVYITYDSCYFTLYEGHLESKERFAIQRYLLIIG